MDNRRWMLMLSLDILHIMSLGQGQPILTIEPANWYTDTNLTITCEIPGVILSPMTFTKDGTVLYNCHLIGVPCSHKDTIGDYSSVDWSTPEKGIITIANAKSTRDNGNWTCEGNAGSSNIQDLNVTDAVCGKQLTISKGNVEYKGDTYRYTAEYTCKDEYSIEGNTTTTCQANGEWSEVSPVCLVSEPECSQCWYYWLFLLMLIPLVGLVVVIIFVSRYKTLVIRTLYVHVTKNIVKLKLKPEIEPLPNTTYATCVQYGLTENAEFIDGLLVVEFRDLTPERQHDVTVYCQNAADMKLYKSETCVVFTLNDSSNTNPKNCNPVLALHSLDMTVYQKKVELSWTSPIAFDSTKVEYWVGSDKHITISANKPSPATSTAEMTRLLPGRMITFTITGEKDGTKYPSGILHQKTLKGLTDCCP